MNILRVPIEEELKQSYLDYAMSVIIGRAIPDIRDGLKPVQRRILYTMYELNLYPDKPYKKCARVVGGVLANYHPHGDAPVYEALVRMAQDFNMRYPLIDPQGNFGSIDGDPPAAQRYTECRLSKFSFENFFGEDINKNTVNFRPNYDNTTLEPEVLPSKLPHILINGSIGIAVGMATQIPPHNLKEVCEAIKFYLDNRQASVKDLMEYIKGPDFPTGAEIINKKDLENIYKTGKGTIVIRSKYKIESSSRGKSNIVITEIPYLVNKAELVKQIARLVRDKKIDGISDIRDESDKEGIRIVIEVKKDFNPEVILSKLFELTDLQTNYHVNMIAIVDGEPKEVNLKDILDEFIKFRTSVILRRANFDLQKVKDRLHIIEGLLVALKDIDKVIKLIKESKETKEALLKLQEMYNLSEKQASSILDMKLSKLTSLEKEKLEREEKELLDKKAYLEKVLNEPSEVINIIKNELDYMMEKFEDERRTKLSEKPIKYIPQIEIEDKELIFALSKEGNIKLLSLEEVSKLKRFFDKDIVKLLVKTNAQDTLLIFSNFGKAYKLPAYEIGKIKNIKSLLPLAPNEEIVSIINTKDFNKEIFTLTKRGYIKRLSIKDFENISHTGIKCVNLQAGDTLVDVKTAKKYVFISTALGKAIKFLGEEIRLMTLGARGVQGISLSKGDFANTLNTFEKENNLFVCTFTKEGYVKKTPISEYPLQRRAGKGVITVRLSEGDLLLKAYTLKPEDKVILGLEDKSVKRIKVKNISTLGRDTKGEKIVDKKIEEVAVWQED